MKWVEYKQKSGKIGETVWTQVLSSGIPVISILKKEPEAGNEMIKQLPLLPVTLVTDTEQILKRSFAALWGCAECKANGRGNGDYRRSEERDILMAVG